MLFSIFGPPHAPLKSGAAKPNWVDLLGKVLDRSGSVIFGYQSVFKVNVPCPLHGKLSCKKNGDVSFEYDFIKAK